MTCNFCTVLLLLKSRETTERKMNLTKTSPYQAVMTSTEYRRAIVKCLIQAYSLPMLEGGNLLHSFNKSHPKIAYHVYEILESFCYPYHQSKYIYDYQVEALNMANLFLKNNLEKIKPDSRLTKNYLKEINDKISKIFENPKM